MTIHLTDPEGDAILEVDAVEHLMPPEPEAPVNGKEITVIDPERGLTPVDQVMGMIGAASRDPAVDVAKLRELFGLQKDLLAMHGQQQFQAALGRIQAKAPRIPKNGIVNLGTNNEGKVQRYNFSRWEDMNALIGPILSEEGFTVTFSEVTSDQNGIRWGATWRAFGHSETNFITLPPDTGAGRNPLQARGSTNSYAKRYLTEDFLKLVRDGADDDGRAGGKEYLTDKELATLRGLLEETATNEKEFLKAMVDPVAEGEEIKGLNEVNRLAFGRLANALARKRNQMAMAQKRTAEATGGPN